MMQAIRTFICMAVLLMAVQVCSRGADQGAPSTRSPSASKGDVRTLAADNDYIIGNEDVLAIQVWKEPDLSRAFTVRPDGKITLPLVGDVKAAGLTPLELQKKLADSLGALMESPRVSVMVQEARSQRINVVGGVTRPGTYPLAKPMTVLDALAVAGGFRDFARTGKMFILRNMADGSRRHIPVNYKKVIGVKGPTENFELQARDTLVVP
jgi:polysaccharide export outer membrane protein